MNNKVVSNPGLKIIHYKGYTIEWIEHLQAYRVCKKEKPEEIMGYSDTIQECQHNIDEQCIDTKKQAISPFENMNSYLSVFAN